MRKGNTGVKVMVSLRLGHSRGTTTLDVYGRIVPSRHKRLAGGSVEAIATDKYVLVIGTGSISAPVPFPFGSVAQRIVSLADEGPQNARYVKPWASAHSPTAMFATAARTRNSLNPTQWQTLNGSLPFTFTAVFRNLVRPKRALRQPTQGRYPKSDAI